MIMACLSPMLEEDFGLTLPAGKWWCNACGDADIEHRGNLCVTLEPEVGGGAS